MRADAGEPCECSACSCSAACCVRRAWPARETSWASMTPAFLSAAEKGVSCRLTHCRRHGTSGSGSPSMRGGGRKRFASSRSASTTTSRCSSTGTHSIERVTVPGLLPTCDKEGREGVAEAAEARGRGRGEGTAAHRVEVAREGRRAAGARARPRGVRRARADEDEGLARDAELLHARHRGEPGAAAVALGLKRHHRLLEGEAGAEEGCSGRGRERERGREGEARRGHWRGRGEGGRGG
jgi:hypothetical protein